MDSKGAAMPISSLEIIFLSGPSERRKFEMHCLLLRGPGSPCCGPLPSSICAVWGKLCKLHLRNMKDPRPLLPPSAVRAEDLASRPLSMAAVLQRNNTQRREGKAGRVVPDWGLWGLCHRHENQWPKEICLAQAASCCPFSSQSPWLFAVAITVVPNYIYKDPLGFCNQYTVRYRK